MSDMSAVEVEAVCWANVHLGRMEFVGFDDQTGRPHFRLTDTGKTWADAMLEEYR